jgi:hypothetical protein
VWQLTLVEELVDAHVDAPIEDRDRHGPVRLGDHIVLEAPLGQVVDRGVQAAVVAGGRRIRRHARPRDEQLRRFVDDREPDVAVIEQHVRRAGVTGVLHLVMQSEGRAADRRLDPPPQGDVLAEHRRLLHHAFGPKDAFVTVPPLAVTGEACREGPDPTHHPVRLGRLEMRLVELLRGVLAADQRVIQARGRHEPAGEASEPAHAFGLGEPGTDEARRRDPGERHAPNLAATDIEGPIDDDVEHESRPGPELEESDTALDPVAGGHQAHAGDLLESADPAHQVGPAVRGTEQAGHDAPFSGRRS